MTTIRLTNTATRRKEEFVPLDPGNVRMYVCGPTVYDRAHLGNARPVVVFDVLFRLLRHVYGADHVTYVRNFTDVDDKINARAAEVGRPIREITDETIRWYHQDMDALGALRPTQEPRATDWIGAMVAMIGRLVAQGHAYAAEGHVLFAVDSYAAYGRLSGRTVEDMIAGARVEVAPYKRNPMDFVLWKPSTPDLPGWDSPWGRGRPGWHIECSAMARELLGDTFDIHGGGIDLLFPHHENEIAQSTCAHPEGQFARVWLHNEMLLVEGKKMSKSLGNFFTVRDLLGQGVPGEVIRIAFLRSHYRDEMDFSAKRQFEAQQLLTEFSRALGKAGVSGINFLIEEQETAPPFDDVVESLADDLDTNRALDKIQRHVKAFPANAAMRLHHLSRVNSSLKLIGLNLAGSKTALDHAMNHDDAILNSLRSLEENAKIERFRHAIAEARSTKNYSRSDELVQSLNRAGVNVQISRELVHLERLPHFDPAKLEAIE